MTLIDGNRIYNDEPFPSVDDWIRNLNRACFVVTDSFHGTVFSILFNKQFVSIGNASRGLSRFQSLLGMFGLESRLVGDASEADVSVLLGNEIDFDNVNAVLAVKRSLSLNFLSGVLSN